ncbi:hypothetical protein HZC53_01940 [Candidatus Uhrbacteria bacterium]|nr:hypothetical protein [Candidatus Uhrbacteria bacterium]
MKNAKHLGEATVFIYPSKDRYIGVCLELDLIDEDSDRDILVDRMKRRVESYVAFIHKKNYDDSLLNRPAPKKYWNKFYQFLSLMKEEEKKHIRSTTAPASRPAASSTRDFFVSRRSLVCEPA